MLRCGAKRMAKWGVALWLLVRRHAVPAGLALSTALITLPAQAEPADHAALAQRFRPYYRFSNEGGALAIQEKARPASWEWFVRHSELRDGSRLILSNDALKENPASILSQNNGTASTDVRSSPKKTAPFTLHPAALSFEGEPWAASAQDGAGLYAQVEELPETHQVLIVYWTLYMFNLATGGPAFWHEGDITAVAVVYDRDSDSLVRASFVIHGPIVESFDLQNPESVRAETLHGVTYQGKPESVIARVSRIAANHRYQNGPSRHSPARPSDIYFTRDSRTGKFDHLALFIEWGTHEAWPNPHGSATAAPKHNGDGVAFLPARVRFAGSINATDELQAPLFFFNGKWGDPPSPTFHRISYIGFGIPDDKMTDRDPYHNLPLSWPPERFAHQAMARVQIVCVGNRNDTKVALRWGHPDFHNTEYFPLWKVGKGQTVERTFALSERQSELEIQTEGGEGTGYKVTIWVDLGNGMPAQPSLVLRHNIEGVRDDDVVLNTVGASRSSGLNKYGEQNIRINAEAALSGPIR